VGVDLSYQMNCLALSKLQENGIEKPMVINGYAQFLPFGNSSFNSIVSTFPADFIFEPATIAEIWRTLRPGGSWIWLPTAWITGSDPKSRALAALFRLTQQAPPEITPLPDELLAHLKHLGFEISQELRHLHNSVVLIVTARKPNN
ncbi:MAG: class I SAM-dependent methyltransferase, partial [Anaerolineales bacterium]